jgi:serine/threonine-protein kinase RsbW
MMQSTLGPGQRLRNGKAMELEIPSDPLAVRQALARIMEEVSALAPPDDAQATVEIVLAEVLNNVVEHACAGLSGRCIAITIAPTPTGLRCQVRDNGRPLPGSALPAGDPPDPARRTPELAEGGFGWLLIRGLAYGLRYHRSGGMNVLSFSLDFLNAA